jgi:hypothetical protein
VVFQDVGFHDRVHRAAFFAKTTKNALGQINVIATGTPRSIIANLRFDGNRHRRAHCLAQLAGNTTLFAIFVSAQSMQPAKARGEWGLFFRKLDRHLPPE